ncbi:alpha/beta fold hydrolase [Adhaeribacter radiodurans]|uniref:alpha/beta fold hydrolase n=1 Tax=Adhaeribacter radiodurans TaxID=2745197 RepID=UPI0015FD8898|nr:alpha/beta hydrolase [Adhaeribacter radiodurans]
MLRPFSTISLLLVGLSCLLFSYTARPSKTPVGVSNYTTAKDGTSIFYTTAGKGNITLLFVHCWTCDQTYWRKQLDYFAQNYQVVALDLAGHGKSGPNRKSYTMKSFGGDVAAVAEALKLKRVVLIGHSMGGPVIAEAANQMPGKVIGLIGVDTFKDLDSHPSTTEIDKILQPIKANFKDSLYHIIRHSMFLPTADSQLADQTATHMSSAPPEMGLNAIRHMFEWNGEKTMGALAIPKWMINADYQPTNKEVAAKYGFKVELMSGVGHFPMLEDAPTFNKLLTKAVTQIQSSVASK